MLKSDLHTHSVNSGDGLCTLYEMAQEAQRRGVEILGVVSHGPGMEKAFPEEAYPVFIRVPKYISGVRILMGIEMNIIDELGNVDVRKESFRYLGVRIAGLHEDLGSEEKNTAAIINAIKNPEIHLISHPYCYFRTDIVAIARAAVKYGKLLELNNSTFKYIPRERRFMENAAAMVRVLQEGGQSLILNSDAHVASDIAEDEHILRCREELGLKDSSIINNDLGRLKRILGIGEE